MHKKYFEKDGKKYGPYLYENKRVGQKVVTNYLGKSPTGFDGGFSNFSKRKKLIVGLYILLAIIGILLILDITLQISPTGWVSVSLSPNYVEGEQLGGLIDLGISGGELIPKDTQVYVTLGGQEQIFNLSDLISDPVISGNFYAGGSYLSGSGEGYGLIGKKIISPTIDFKMIVSTNPSSSGESSNNNSNDNSNDNVPNDSSNETVASNETTASETTAPVSSDNGSEPSANTNENPVLPETPTTPASDIPASDSAPLDSGSTSSSPEGVSTPASDSSSSSSGSDSSSSASSGSEVSSGITGAIVGESEFVLDGQVSSDKPFEYNLGENQIAKIVEGSVKLNETSIEDSAVNLETTDGKVMVTTSYGSSEEQGFGEDFVTADIKKISINIKKLNLTAQNGSLQIRFIYNNSIITSAEKQIVTLPSHSNFTQIVAGNKTLILIKDIPTLRIKSGSLGIINLTEYFENAKSYGFSVPNLSGSVSDGILTINADSGFFGARKVRVLAYSGDEVLESNEFNVLVSSGNIDVSTSRGEIKVGESVKWVANISLEVSENVTLSIPVSAENITVLKSGRGEFEKINPEIKKITGDNTEIIQSSSENNGLITGNVVMDVKVKKKVSIFLVILNGIRKITGFAVSDNLETITAPIVSNTDNIQVSIPGNENATNYVVEYYTPAPTASETNESYGKQVVISADSALGYENVLSYTNIPEIYSVGEENKIKIYWVENKSYVPFDAYDLDGNGKLDYVEWMTPHLSDQTFEIILITKAEHLDSSRNFISDIYDSVRALDGNWSEIINSGEYVRVKFEKNLTNINDVTVYAKSTDNNFASIEVYIKDSNESIGVISNITGENTYKTLLTAMAGGVSSNEFDLRVVGSVQFDYIVDPLLVTKVVTNIDGNPNFAGNYYDDGVYNGQPRYKGLIGADYRYIWYDPTGPVWLICAKETNDPPLFPIYVGGATINGIYSGAVGATGTLSIGDPISNMVIGCGNITSSGTYTLQNNILTTGTCFNITAENVTLDLNGYTITGSADGGTGADISAKNVVIKNGIIRAFSVGIKAFDLVASNITIFNNTLDEVSMSNTYAVAVTSVNNTFSNNIILNSQFGLSCGPGSSGNRFIENNLSLNTNGIFVDTCTGNTFQNNIFNSNTNDFNIFSSSSNLVIYNNSQGEIRWLKDNFGANGVSFPGNINISNNSVYLNSNAIPELNVSANITLYGMGNRGFVIPKILKNGQICNSCYNFTSLTADTILFNVSSWSNYSIGGIYSAGAGSVENPYQIASWAHLDNMRLNLTAYYILTKNLSSADSDYSGIGDSWNPVGNSSTGWQFTGNFNGQNNTISNLIINLPLIDNVGLFGYALGNISNLGLINVNITGHSTVGSITGFSGISSSITNVSSSGTINGEGNYVGGVVGNSYKNLFSLHSSANVATLGNYAGGLVGLQSNGNISNSYFTGSVTAVNYAGGIVGSQSGGVINISYVVGNVNGTFGIGGIIGYQSGGNIYNSYSFANVTGTGNNIGGFIGLEQGGNVINSYAAGNVTSPGTNIGGLIGAKSSGTVTNSYWDMGTSGKLTSAAGIGLTTSEMKRYFPFASLWSINGSASNLNNGYPYLGWQAGISSTVWLTPAVYPYQVGDDGSVLHPYQISSWAGLDAMRLNFTANYVLIANLSFINLDYLGIGDNWNPVGNYTAGYYFRGNFNGGGNTISNLIINKTSGDAVGLFGYILGNVSNLGLISVNVTGYSNVGGLVGDSSGIISNCYATGNVVSLRSNDLAYAGLLAGNTAGLVTNSYSSGNIFGSTAGSYGGAIGGLVGYIYGRGIVNSSYSNANVNGKSILGGLVGDLRNGTIKESYALGNVNGTQDCGGLAGVQNMNTEEYLGLMPSAFALINNSYSNANVTCSNYAGGLVGETISANISNSYSTGNLSFYGSNIGGLVGFNLGTVVSNSYWDTQISGQVTSSGGIGKITAEMKSYIPFISWNISGNAADLNNGYPYLGWQSGTNSNVWLIPATPSGVSSCIALNIPNYVYTLQNDVTSSGTCFNITADNITLNGNGKTITSLGGLAINVTGTRTNLTIKNVNINANTGGIYFAGNTTSLLIYNNTLSGNLSDVVSFNPYTVLFNSTISNNVIMQLSSSRRGIYLWNSSLNNISFNRINSSGGGILVDSVSSSDIISNNNISGTYGIYIYYGSFGVQIINNNITSSNSAIILSSDANSNIISNNVLVTGSVGIVSNYLSFNNTISNNNIISGSDGIDLASWGTIQSLSASSGDRIIGNTIVSDYDVIWFGWNATNNIISGNNLSSRVTFGRGIYFMDTINSTVYNNTISTYNNSIVFSTNDVSFSKKRVVSNNITTNTLISSLANGIYSDINSTNNTLSNNYIDSALSSIVITNGTNNILNYMNSNGELKYLRNTFNITSSLKWGTDIILSNHSVFVNSAVIPVLNSSANITFYGTEVYGGQYPSYLLGMAMDGRRCNSSICNNFTSLIGPSIIINVSNFGAGLISVGRAPRSSFNVSLSSGWNMISLELTSNVTGERNFTLTPGWNMVGVSTESLIDHGDLKYIDSNGTSTALAFASSEGLVQKQVAYYDLDNSTNLKRYKYAPKETEALQTGRAYWVYVNDPAGGILTMPNVGGNNQTETFSINNLLFENMSSGDVKNITDATLANWVDPNIRFWVNDSECRDLAIYPNCFVSVAEERNSLLYSWAGYFVNTTSNNITLLRES